ncbi:MucBP domain-containing protein [Listeria monocytogenes]|nr:MucBP domain-containing protein [Listeria monocytogenes]EIP9776593.1 MucBP domain-containing protein [Listeria monocytogenes]EIZ2739489.1 MucBP domain-containing protein [Listeria monocytogenes]EIZ2742417.1 MucBP domain-containing protein [Listeria monocytogenes]EIZ2756902.1 MucBP domain-containing protein [Listeria monocytogenes]
MLKKIFIALIALVVIINTVSFTAVSASTPTWLEQTMNSNEPFIKEIEKETGKTRANITQTDLEAITALRVTGASDIPTNIDMLTHLTTLEVKNGTLSSVSNSVGNLKELKILVLNDNNLSTFPMIAFQLPKLEELQVSGGTIEEIPATITNMASHLKFLGILNNHLVKVPDAIFTTNWTNATGGDLDLMAAGNQIVTNIPANYISQFNNGDNLLEFYDNNYQKQDQLTTTPGYTIDVPVGTDFNQLTPDKTKLALTSGRTLLAQHEFEYYDDGSSSLIHNGVAAAPGQATIFIKSKFSTQSNKFARTQVTVNITALNGGPITVKHEDTKGQELAPPVILNGKDGDPYTTTQKTFPGYTLVATPANQNGTFTMNPATVNYVYSANDYKLTSTFKDAQGQELKAPVVDTKDYHIQDNYTTTAATIPGYSLVATPANQNGTFGAGNVTVNYVYKKDDYTLTSTYKDTNGQELKAPVVDATTYHYQDTYTTTAAVFPGYTLVATPTNATGTFGSSNITVHYVYQANGYQLTSTFKDQQGKTISPDDVDTKTYHVNDPYTTTAKTIPGYTLVTTPTNNQGNFGTSDITVDYVYKAEDYTLTSTYKDAQGKELKQPVVDSKKYHIQDNYSTSAATIPGYTLVSTPANETGTFHTSDVKVNYVYKLTDLKLTSTYKDAQGTELKPPVVDSKTYHIQDNYATTAAVIPGYTLVATPANQSGTFGSTDIQVNYVYQAVAYKLTSTYKDQQGNDLALPKVDSKTYHIQDGYTTSDIAIPGYTLVAAPTNQTGTFGASDVTVNYVYKANDYTLTSTYKDAQGKELKTPVIDSQKYHINDTYTTTGATIPGYTLVAAPANQSGTFGAANVTVNYVYKADDYTLTSTYKDANGKELKAPVVDSKTYHTKDNYSTSAATIPGYTLVAAPTNQTGTFNTSNVTVNYVYKANEYTLTSTFKNVQGTELKPAIVKKGFIIKDGYATSGVTIPGYTLVATPSNKKGTFGASNVTVNYVYKANGYALITTYKDTQGKDLKPLAIDTKTYNINDPYTATALNISGYTLTTTPANEKGVFGASDETVNYVYKANDYTLTTTYKDANGKELQAPKVDAKTYHIQDTYKTTAAIIPGYTLVATPKNDQGTFGASNVTVNYVYQTNDYTLTSTFKDAQGNELKAAEVDAQKYHIHDTYTSKAAVIPGYSLEKTPTNETGTFNASDIQVNYVYKANDYQLTSTFKDQQGNEIALPTVDAKTYHIHDAYTTKAHLIPGYSLVAAPKNQIGAFGTSDVTVNYVYKKDAIIKPITPAKPTILTIKTPESKVVKTKVVKQTLPKTGDDDAGLLNLLRLIGLVLILGVFLAVGSKKLR